MISRACTAAAALAAAFLVSSSRLLVDGFSIAATVSSRRSTTTTGMQRHSRRQDLLTRTVLNCICIDCALVVNCSAYHFVETKHEQPHMTENPTFTPRDGSPTIHVNVRTVRSSASDFDQIRAEHEQETAKAMAASAATASAASNLHGETVYDLAPVTTYEYDVVQCADFVADKGCWIRHMPEEIRRANPDFVPT